MLWSANWSSQDQLYFCVARDISQSKQAQRLKQQLIDMVSHDLRTPLTSINGMLTLMTILIFTVLLLTACPKKIEIARIETERLVKRSE